LAKVTKTVSAEMLLCRQGPWRTSRKNSWAAIFLLNYLIALLLCMQKVAMPQPTSLAFCFSRFFPKLFS
jgi:hypothetical protein